ncbi:hypothetical protein [Spirillospora sp. NBC_01491]|uniref:hypothetical protein n=1 Tax=Spirillospora sp. NBC_01491 TaxID=2976007 RepID=UPI002E317C57|nr:hypothetical protein [Spirillospora sp. NBC_01491]
MTWTTRTAALALAAAIPAGALAAPAMAQADAPPASAPAGSAQAVQLKGCGTHLSKPARIKPGSRYRVAAKAESTTACNGTWKFRATIQVYIDKHWKVITAKKWTGRDRVTLVKNCPSGKKRAFRTKIYVTHGGTSTHKSKTVHLYC